MSKHTGLDISIGQLIFSSTVQYKVQALLGTGTYGTVMRCRNLNTNEIVALKVIKNKEYIKFARREGATLRSMRKINSESFNIVRLKNSFTFRGHYCLEFELLDMKLVDLLTISPCHHLQLKQIRPILQQLATSLDFLKNAGFIHGDLKPENIMLVDHVNQPFRVKIIDFGLACKNPEEMSGLTLQSLWYRSPEVLSKTHFNEAIDVWSLGCIAAEMFMGRPVFQARDKLDLMAQILHTAGKPLGADDNRPYCFWPKLYLRQRFISTHSGFLKVDDYIEYCDLVWFIDLLIKMLTINSYTRITPRGILKHPFLTMNHLERYVYNSLYVRSSMELMRGAWKQNSKDEGARAQKIQRTSRGSSSSVSSAAKPLQLKKSRDATLKTSSARGGR